MPKLPLACLVILFITAPLFLSAQTSVGPVAGKGKGLDLPLAKLFFEKVYLHINSDVCLPGDTIWYKAYLVNAQNHKVINTSNILYTELIAPDARIVDSRMIRMDNGIGIGDFELADSIAPGQYKLRAYTNWMRNFADAFIFEKSIIILNTTALIGVSTKATNTVSVNASANTATPGPVLQFYPEGGSLITGISSLIAVKVQDAAGLGVPASGAILSSMGDTITRFKCDTLGMGLFTLLPLQGQQYHAVAITGNQSSQQTSSIITADVPAALKGGLALHLKEADSLLHVVISKSNMPIADSAYTLVLKHGGQMLFYQQVQATGLQTAVELPKSILPEGVVSITLYDAAHRPQAERLIYIHQPKAFNAVLATDKRVYTSKEKTTITINTRRIANLSMAVVDQQVIPDQSDDILSYLMLGSELRGKVEHIQRYFDTTNVNRFQQLDLLLMTQGWRDFIWHRFADSLLHIGYMPEKSINIAGKVRDEVKNKMMHGLNISLFASGAKGIKLMSTRSDSLGQFSFTGLTFYGVQNIKLAAMNAKGEKKGAITIDTIPAVQILTAIKTASETIADSITAGTLLKRYETANKVDISRVTRLKEVKIKAKREPRLNDNGIHMSWGEGQVFNIIPKDYQYRTLEWFLLQNAKGAMISNDVNITGVVFPTEGLSIIKAPTLSGSINTSHTTTTLQPPILFVNGRQLEMADPAQAEMQRMLYFNLPLQKFKKIVLKEMPGGNYLVYLTVTDDALIDNPGSLSVDIPGYYQARTFYKPVYGAEQPAVPDFRTTIHWEPNIKTDAQGKATVDFFNPGNATSVKVIVQGITNDGTPINKVLSYEVK